MRTVVEMVEAAIERNRELIIACDDPHEHEFECTNAELLLLKNEPWPTPAYAINFERDRICGLKIKVTE